MDAYQYHWYSPKCSLFLDEVRVLQTYEPADGGFGSAAYSTILGFIGICAKSHPSEMVAVGIRASLTCDKPG